VLPDRLLCQGADGLLPVVEFTPGDGGALPVQSARLLDQRDADPAEHLGVIWQGWTPAFFTSVSMWASSDPW
jgi:hypothetical protein